MNKFVGFSLELFSLADLFLLPALSLAWACLASLQYHFLDTHTVHQASLL